MSTQLLTKVVGIPAATLSVALAGFGACSAAAGSAPLCAGGESAPGVTAKEIRLGLLYPYSGVSAADFVAARGGVDARLGAVNAAGGIHGRKVVYSWRDDGGVPARNLVGARQLVEDENVFGVIDFTLVTEGGAKYMADRGIPAVSFGGDATGTQYATMFTPVSAIGAVDTYGRLVAARGGASAVLLRTGLSPGIADAMGRVGQSLQAAGVRVSAELSYTPGADSPDILAAQIAGADADTIVAMLAPAALPPVLRAVRAAGVNPAVVLSLAGYDRDLLRTAGVDLAGMYLPVVHRPLESGGPAVARYADDMRRYAPEITNPAQEFGLMAYIDTDLFLRGLEAAGACPTRSSFVAGLRTLTRYDAGGLLPPVNMGAALRTRPPCPAVLQVNPAGTALDVVEGNTCGRPLDPA